MPSLFVIQGQDQGKRFDLDRLCTTVGRDTVNHVRLNDSEASRQHAEIRQDDIGENYYLTDLGSSNGTYVNGKIIERHVLQSGDRVQFGGTLVIYTGPDVGTVDALADGVDIVASGEQESQIISSFPHDENSQFFYGDALDQDSPWLVRARSNLQVMYRTALAVSHTLDIDELLTRIMELIFEWVEADRGVILLKDRATGELLPRARQNRPGIKTGADGDEKLTISRTILDHVLSNSEGVLTSDAQDDDRFDDAGSIIKMGVREAIGVPMQGRYGVVGVIYIDTYTPPDDWVKGTTKKFNEEHLKMMIAIAHQAALAVEDTAYYSAMLQSERLAAIGQTIAGLSHHVKNILQGIRGGSYLIEEGLKSTETDLVRTGWGIVEKNQEKISRLVLDMLTFSKERQPEVESADLHGTVSEVVELMSARAAECGVDLQFEPDPALPTIRFDTEGIHHALLNVVANAIDACEAATLNLADRMEELEAEETGSDEQATDEQANDENVEEEPVESLEAEIQRSAEMGIASLKRFAKSVDDDEKDPADWASVVDDQSEEESAGAESMDDSDGEASTDAGEDAAEEEDAEDKAEEVGASDDEESKGEDEAELEPIAEDEAGEAKAEDDSTEDDSTEDDSTEDDSTEDDSVKDAESDGGSSEVAAEDDSEVEELVLLDEDILGTAPRRAVRVSTHYLEEDRVVEVRVKDNGEGIAEQDLKQIFVVFNSTKGNQGTGLGLSVSQKILHEHGGDIRVTSERGQGSTFTLVLPAVVGEIGEVDASNDPSHGDATVDGDIGVNDAGTSKDDSAIAQD